MLAPPVTALGLRLSDEEVRIAVGLRLGTTLCEPHLCHQCREIVDAKGLHGLVCRSGNGKYLRHSMINDVVWRLFGRAKIPAQKEPLRLSRNDGKRPDGVTIIPWKRGLCLTWDVTVPDTYAMSRLAHTSINAGEAAERSAESKRMKYSTITNTHAFVAVALETGGAWCREGLQLISELGNRIQLTIQWRRHTYSSASLWLLNEGMPSVSQELCHHSVKNLVEHQTDQFPMVLPRHHLLSR